MAPEMYEERYDEAVDVYAFGMCMLEMATSEYPYNECSMPAQIYKKVSTGVKPASFDKVENDQVRQIVSQCIQLQKDDRPSCRDLLNSEFFSDDIGIKLQPLSKEAFINSVDCKTIEFRLRLLDSKQRTYKHKENEAIQFEFDIDADNTDDIARDMFCANIISEQDSKTVAKLLNVQVAAILKERREKVASAGQPQQFGGVVGSAASSPVELNQQLLKVPELMSPSMLSSNQFPHQNPLPELQIPVLLVAENSMNAPPLEADNNLSPLQQVNTIIFKLKMQIINVFSTV